MRRCHQKQGNRKSLRELLQSGTWDFVTIQQYSFISNDVSTYRPYARNLHDYIRKNAPGAEVVMHQTWEYRVDDPRFTCTGGCLLGPERGSADWPEGKE